MKKLKVLGILMVMILVIAGCTNKSKDMNNDETMEKTQKEDMMNDTIKDNNMNDKMDNEETQHDGMMDEEKDDTNMNSSMTEEKAMDDMKNKGEDAPVFELVDTNGNTHKLADYKGEKVYIKFWASWCSICLVGLDEIDELAGEETAFKVLTVVSPGFSGEKKSESFTKWFNGLNKMNMPVLLDEGGKIAKAYGVRGYPTSAYIGSDGVLVKKLPGHNSNDQIKESFNAIH